MTVNDKGTCRDCALKENCAEYKENKSQCEDYESYNEVLTNEEWFCSLPTKEKAKEMCVIMADMAEANDGVWNEEMIEEWLKEKHE